ncbi:hypothetical protein [Halorubrum coriense]|nr:hypothetical protein [Halorubrum coriense]
MYPEPVAERLGPRRASAGVGAAAIRGLGTPRLGDDPAPTAGPR